MNIDIVTLQPLVALIAGVLILLLPQILNYVVAIYLIVIGIIGLSPHMMLFHASSDRDVAGDRAFPRA